MFESRLTPPPLPSPTRGEGARRASGTCCDSYRFAGDLLARSFAGTTQATLHNSSGLRMICAVVAALAVFGATAANAQTYPDRPVRLIVPFPAGGLNDGVRSEEHTSELQSQSNL